MCGIWKEKETVDKELSLKSYDVLLHDRLFSCLEYIGISGGEPFIRKDLVEMIELFQERCVALKRISITTNGILTKRIESSLDRLIGALKSRGVLLDISISFHGLGNLLSHIYGVEGAFDKISQTIALLKSYRRNNELTFSLNCVLLSENLETAPAILNWAADNDAPINFVLGEQRERFFNDEMKSTFMKEEQRERLVEFLRDLSRDGSFKNPGRIKYRELIDMIEGRKHRSLSCYYAFSGFLLGYDGTLYYCSHSDGIGNCLKRSAYDLYYDPDNLRYRQAELIEKECRYCPPYTRTRMEMEKDLYKIFKFVLKDKISGKSGPGR
jgi:MoaA/NifB/PqqE/SkfB family radical SAM enzyme